MAQYIAEYEIEIRLHDGRVITTTSIKINGIYLILSDGTKVKIIDISILHIFEKTKGQ